MRQKLPRFWNRCFEFQKSQEERRHSVIPILLAFGEITHFEGGGGGRGDSLKKVGTDVRRVQNLRPQKQCLGKKYPKT